MSTFHIVQRTAVYAGAESSRKYPQRPGLSAMLVMVTDIDCLALILWVFLGNTTTWQLAIPGGWLSLLPIFLVVYSLFGLYPGVSVSPVKEIRSLVLANISVFLFISLTSGLHQGTVIPQLVCVSACACGSVLILTMRATVRRCASSFAWWGYPVVLFGGGEVALSVLCKLKRQSHLGLRPVALVTDERVNMRVEGVSICSFDHFNRIASSGIKHAIVVAPELSRLEFAELLERGGDAFPHLIIIPDTNLILKVGSYTRDFMGVTGLQVRNNLLSNGSRFAKRAVDLVFAAMLTLCLLPLIAIISLAIVLASGFPMFYSQNRLGRGGQTFRIWKFRTMVRNSSEVLEQCLTASPALLKEWAVDHKLRHDPRITLIGNLLRKTSLDELPQLWNVIKGEMSLVGPRPIVDEEIPKYNNSYSIYVKTTPGLTGLWQVSGRNHTTYEQRVAFDTYYVRNWSFWLDLYLLARTVGVVLTGDGAY